LISSGNTIEKYFNIVALLTDQKSYSRLKVFLHIILLRLRSTNMNNAIQKNAQSQILKNCRNANNNQQHTI
ncbi:hypothetical protein HZS_2259, partial [Henneguya salminicola]